MSFKEDIDAIIIQWGDKLAIDLKASLEAALKLGGSKNVQESSVTFQPKYTINEQGTKIEIVTKQEHWKYIELGRKPGKMPPPNKLGKDWQLSQKIDARKVIAEINIKHNKGLRRKSKGLSFDAAAKQLSFIIARSIGKKGLKPRPYIDSVLKDGRITQLTKDISKAMSKDIKIELTIK
jgi:hypothetical protein